MSKYTTEVRFICEQIAGTGKSITETIATAREHVFNFDYPIFDEHYRNTLETKILKHYYFREIGAETVGLWKAWLDMKMNEIMPYYNKLYLTELLDYNPLYTTNLTRTRKKENTLTEHLTENGKESGVGSLTSKAQSANENSITENSTTDSKQLYSDTPQGSLARIENNTYLTSATINTDSESRTSGSGSTANKQEESANKYDVERENGKEKQGSNVEDYVETVKGYDSVNVNKTVKEFRANLLNIDLQVISELEVLFMNLW